MPYSTAENLTDTPASTAVHFAVRVGMHGQVGRFASGQSVYRRGCQVICRTVRGLEVGQVLSPLEWSGSATRREDLDGRIVRTMLPEDQLLWNQLKHLADEAQASCQAWLDASSLPDRLLDVEPLLDGRTLYFHFLDQVSSETASQIERLVQIYQDTVASSSFVQLLENGCGPGCGTDAAKGCSSCRSCAVVNRCASKKSDRRLKD